MQIDDTYERIFHPTLNGGCFRIIRNTFLCLWGWWHFSPLLFNSAKAFTLDSRRWKKIHHSIPCMPPFFFAEFNSYTAQPPPRGDVSSRWCKMCEKNENMMIARVQKCATLFTALGDGFWEQGVAVPLSDRMRIFTFWRGCGKMSIGWMRLYAYM